jgi:hypothetical protein
MQSFFKKDKMLSRNLLLLSLIQVPFLIFSQCIDREKIKYGGDYDAVDYIHLCPTYSFAFGGDTSTLWNVLTDPIDIMQAPKEILPLKHNIEQKIKNYSGEIFFNDLKFSSVEIVYKNKLKKFIDSGRQGVTLKYCKAKYFFFYKYKPDTLATYLVGIAVSKKGTILNKFKFPSKKDFKSIDTHISQCKLVEIARKSQNNMDPIEEISFEYDDVEKKFYWLVSQEIVDMKEGENHFNQVRIDASNTSEVKKITGSAIIQF